MAKNYAGGSLNLFYVELYEQMKRKNKGREKPVTILGKETVFDGILKFSDTLRIDGKFTGAIDAQGALIVSKGAECRVQYARADSVIVEGSVVGSIAAADKIELRSESSVRGDISAGRIKIADKVLFEGSVKMIQNNSFAEKNIFSIQTEQLKDQLRRK